MVDAQIRPAPRGMWIDTLFFIVAGAEAVWFALLLLDNSFHFGWSLVLLVPFWAVTAYLTLPRLHRILSSMYVPDYFFGRTRTSEGMLGDPVNLALDGTAAQIHAAMTAAGWTLADPVTLKSSWRIVVSSVLRRSYPEAPVSPLHLFGRKQDLAYQQEVEGNPSQRHHVRFWRCPDDWPLPGGRRVGWLGAGTYDTAVGLSLFTLQITHRIDENIDVERDYIIDSLVTAEPRVSVDVIREFSTGYHHRNGGGDRVRTDGDLPVVDVTAVPATIDSGYPEQVRAAALGFRVPDGPSAGPDPGAAALPDSRPLSDGGDSRDAATTVAGAPVQRPPALLLALVMLMVSISAQFGLLAYAIFAPGDAGASEIIGGPGAPDLGRDIGIDKTPEFDAAAIVAILGAWVVLVTVLTVLTLLGYRLPRLMLMAVIAVGLALQLLDGRAAAGESFTVHLLTTAVSLIALLALSSDPVRQWVRHGRAVPHRG